ncbi:MAG: DUF1192 domain-containing protein [Alphaproteobacteria bacterium]|nr:DUF1192 domain-containing protein [Alphaproteobacteria bacterium]
MARDEDDGPRKKTVHEIGQDLSLLSVDDLHERIMVLRDEIARIETALAKKRASRASADAFFRS